MYGPAPSTPRSPRQEQKCDTCRYVKKCYSESTSSRNVVLNILACRIRLNIKREESSRLFLKMVRPNLIRLVSYAISKVGNNYIDMDTSIMDLESKIIECFIDEKHGYRIGESAYLTEYLFGINPKTGWVRKWILWSFQKQQKFYSRHDFCGSALRIDSGKDVFNNELDTKDTLEEEYNNRDIIESIINIINDGITLNVNEYRVIAFCLVHANESNKTRLIDGTHTYLSKVMGVSRPRITRLYAVARKKLLIAARQCGIDL